MRHSLLLFCFAALFGMSSCTLVDPETKVLTPDSDLQEELEFDVALYNELLAAYKAAPKAQRLQQQGEYDELMKRSTRERFVGRTVRETNAGSAKVSSWTEGGTIEWFDYEDDGVWFDVETLVPSLTVHRIQEHAYKNLAKRKKFESEAELEQKHGLAKAVHHDDYLVEDQGFEWTYDRGHFVPHNDMDSRESELNTYRVTNIGPQLTELNQRKWAALEEFIRTATAQQGADFEHDQALVFTGCVFDRGAKGPFIPEEGDRKIRIPDGFYKVVFFLGDDNVIDDVYVAYWRQEGKQCFQVKDVDTVEEVEALCKVQFRP